MKDGFEQEKMEARISGSNSMKRQIAWMLQRWSEEKGTKKYSEDKTGGI